jgi:hypothetical protein
MWPVLASICTYTVGGRHHDDRRHTTGFLVCTVLTQRARQCDYIIYGINIYISYILKAHQSEYIIYGIIYTFDRVYIAIGESSPAGHVFDVATM